MAIIKSKLPTELNLKLEETREGRLTGTDLRERIRKLIVARERSEESWKSLDDGNIDEADDYSNKFLISKDARDFKVSCIFCGLNHWHDECQKYKTIQQRKLQIKGTCFVCPSSQEYYYQCKSDRACFQCRRKRGNQSSLCPKKFDEAKVKNNEEEPDEEIIMLVKRSS